MGTAFRLPIVESVDLRQDVLRLRDEWNLELIATVLDENASPLSTAQRGARVGLLFGNEADGLDEQWQSICQRRLTIPMRMGTDSLNVAIAAAIFLHHFS
jgi:tRNA G18 (ribose-2'-O)-methylase SpoU